MPPLDSRAQAWRPVRPQAPSAPPPVVDRAAPSTAGAAEHEAIRRSSSHLSSPRPHARLPRRNVANALDHPLEPIAPLRADELLQPDAMEKPFDIKSQHI